MYVTTSVFDTMLTNLLFDSSAFFPEYILAFTIVWLLVMRLFRTFNRLHLSWVALGFTLLAFLVSWCQWTGALRQYLASPAKMAANSNFQDSFSHLLVYDNFTIFIRMFLLATAALLIWM